MTRQGAIASLALVLLLLAGAAQSAESDQGYFIWRSPDGVIHISDTAPRRDQSTALYLLPPEEESDADKAGTTPKAPPAEEQAPSASEEQSEQTRTEPPQAVDRNGNGREWWQAKKQALLDEKAQCEAIYDSYVKTLKKTDADNQQKVVVLRQKLTLYRQKISDVEAKLANLVEEARLAGAMPGWLR